MNPNDDYTILPDGTVADSPRKVGRLVNAWIDKTLQPNIPWIKGPGDLHTALKEGRTVVVIYENALHFWAHLRAALVTQAVDRWTTGHWKTDIWIMNPTTLLGQFLSPAGPDLLKAEYLVIFAPEWPNTKASQEHANYIMRQRDGLKLPTVLATKSLNSIVSRKPVTWHVKGGAEVMNPTVCPEFKDFMMDDPDVLTIPLVQGNFRGEIKNLNGADPAIIPRRTEEAKK